MMKRRNNPIGDATMSDAAFKTALFPAYTTQQLRNILACRKADGASENFSNSAAIREEIERRRLVANGYVPR